MRPEPLTDLHRAVITVTISRRLRWRVRLGKSLIRLGCWVATLGYREVVE